VNSGFGIACNDGAAVARGEFFVFLNNDTIPKPQWLDALVRYADEHPKASVVGSKLLFPNDTIQHAGVVICQDGYPRHIYTGFPAGHPAVSRSRRFQVVTAACCLIRRDAFEWAGGFDTGYLNGYEDVDLCLRLGERGDEIHYCHTSEIYHLESVSDGRLKEVAPNTRRYAERWRDRVLPDDLSYYVEDRLLRVDYAKSYPLTLHLAPLLGSAGIGDREDQTHRILAARSRQVFDLLRDNVLLNVRVREAELATAPASGNGTRGDAGRGQPSGSGRGTPHVPRHARLVSRGDVLWRSSEPTDRLISIILPVKNGASQLVRLLPRILEQETRDRIEIVAIDSGSSDGSIASLQEHGATVLEIDPAEFNHGGTRNLAARYARGEVLVFVNQSTLPQDEHWLANLTAPFDGDHRIAGVCSRVAPHPEADPLTTFDGLRDPSGSPDRQLRSITDLGEYRRLPGHRVRKLINFHTVSAAIRTDVFRLIPFRDVLMGEDILWAKEVLEAGYSIQHEPSSVVWHSHDYSIFETLQRNVDDGSANHRIVGRTIDLDQIEPMIRALAVADWRHLRSDSGLEGTELEDWQIRSVLRRAAQVVGQWVGTNQELIPWEILQRLSLTEAIKHKIPTLERRTAGD
jgi:GT2 family glycosyltransferase